MKYAAIILTIAATMLAGCDHSAMAASPSGGANVFPSNLPPVKAGKFRLTKTLNGKPMDTPKDSCKPERKVASLMKGQTGDRGCSGMAFETIKAGYRLTAKCDFGAGGGKVDVDTKFIGDAATAFTIDTVTTFERPVAGQSKEVYRERWEYRGAC